MDISARAFSLADRTRRGHVGRSWQATGAGWISASMAYPTCGCRNDANDPKQKRNQTNLYALALAAIFGS
jgi:hypothetical protein